MKNFLKIIGIFILGISLNSASNTDDSSRLVVETNCEIAMKTEYSDGWVTLDNRKRRVYAFNSSLTSFRLGKATYSITKVKKDKANDILVVEANINGSYCELVINFREKSLVQTVQASGGGSIAVCEILKYSGKPF